MPTTLHKAACIIACALVQGRILKRKSGFQTVSLEKDQVQHIAMLARLRLDENEFAETVDKLSRIVEFVDQLSTASTDNVVPMAHPLDRAQRLRPDEISESNDRDNLQKNATEVADGLYLVPKVIE